MVRLALGAVRRRLAAPQAGVLTGPPGHAGGVGPGRRALAHPREERAHPVEAGQVIVASVLRQFLLPGALAARGALFIGRAAQRARAAELAVYAAWANGAPDAIAVRDEAP